MLRRNKFKKFIFQLKTNYAQNVYLKFKLNYSTIYTIYNTLSTYALICFTTLSYTMTNINSILHFSTILYIVYIVL